MACPICNLDEAQGEPIKQKVHADWMSTTLDTTKKKKRYLFIFLNFLVCKGTALIMFNKISRLKKDPDQPSFGLLFWITDVFNSSPFGVF